MYHSLAVHSSAKGHLTCFQILPFIKKAFICIHMLAFEHIPISYSFGKIPRNIIIALYVKSRFNFVRKCQTVLHKCCSTLYSHQHSLPAACWFTFSPALRIVIGQDFVHWNKCAMVSPILNFMYLKDRARGEKEEEEEREGGEGEKRRG